MAESLRMLAAAPVTPLDACLSDDEIVAFAQGCLSPDKLPHAHLHLDACQTCQHLLNEAAHGLATAATTPEASDSEVRWNTTFQPGMVLAQRYRIIRFVARGGMGEVYLALDLELQQRVALKTVAATASDNPDAVRRLKGEVQLARRVSHPNVCRIYDFGTHVMTGGAQISFLTMEFVEGETLGQCVRLGGALPTAEACGLARLLLLGLSAAHDAGVLHRDFKSDNVILRSDGDAAVTPLILDFGLARALDHESQSGAEGGNRTLVGTFGYIAPEQLEGKPHTRASDLYSLGVVWFEMLTGELPFESSSSPAAAVLQRLHHAAPPPSSKNPSISSELDAIVLRCLRRSPRDRFSTAREALQALDAHEQKFRRSRLRRAWPWFALSAAALATTGYALRTPVRGQRARSGTLVATLSSALPARSAPSSSGVAVGSPELVPPRPLRSTTPPVVTAHSATVSTARDGRAPALRPKQSGSEQSGTSAPPSSAPALDSGSVPANAASAQEAPAPPVSSTTGGWEDPFHSR